MGPKDNLLSIRGLGVDIPLAGGILHAVRDVDLDIALGETLCVVGESGSGKSLTALAIMGLLPKTAQCKSEKLVFSGIDLSAAKNRRMRGLRGDRIAMIFQEPMTSLNPAYTIGDQLTEALLVHHKVGGKVAKARASELLVKVGVADGVFLI